MSDVGSKMPVSTKCSKCGAAYFPEAYRRRIHDLTCVGPVTYTSSGEPIYPWQLPPEEPSDER